MRFESIGETKPCKISKQVHVSTHGRGGLKLEITICDFKLGGEMSDRDVVIRVGDTK